MRPGVKGRSAVARVAPRRVHLLVTAILAGSAVACWPAGAQDRPHVFGVGTASGGWTLLDPPGYEEAMWDTLAQVGAVSTRIGASWPQIQPAPAPDYQWGALDAEVALCLDHGITPYCLIVNTPAWAVRGLLHGARLPLRGPDRPLGVLERGERIRLARVQPRRRICALAAACLPRPQGRQPDLHRCAGRNG